MPRPSITVAYIRQSRSKEMQQYSEEVQLSVCKEMYERRKDELPPWAGEYVDINVSGFTHPIASRTEGKKLMAELRKGDCLIVAKLDRLGRIMRDIVGAINTLLDRGVHLIICDQPILADLDPSKAFTQLVISLFACMAQIHSETTPSSQSRDGQLAIGAGATNDQKTPYGMKRGEDEHGKPTYIECVVEKTHMNQAFEMRFGMNWSCNDVVDEFKRRGYKYRGEPWNYWNVYRATQSMRNKSTDEEG